MSMSYLNYKSAEVFMSKKRVFVTISEITDIIDDNSNYVKGVLDEITYHGKNDKMTEICRFVFEYLGHVTTTVKFVQFFFKKWDKIAFEKLSVEQIKPLIKGNKDFLLIIQKRFDTKELRRLKNDIIRCKDVPEMEATIINYKANKLRKNDLILLGD
jgi:hypothetical protein